MQLKRLEAYGFKSFADKITIEFDHGITAIVGPNGSGKSNITDAVRWVLGEQNIRNLRGTRSEDIIFAGSAQRRPLNIAEVSLIFDNDGYNIKYAWVVLSDAFDNKSVPDLNTLKEPEAEKLLSGIMGSNGYEGIMLVNLNAKNKAIYAVTAKEVEIDEDGDGKIDGVAKADTQMAVAFFRTEKGNRYGVELIDNPDLRASSLAAFQKGITTLKDVDSKQLANSKDKKANTKSSKKDKKNKK